MTDTLSTSCLKTVHSDCVVWTTVQNYKTVFCTCLLWIIPKKINFRWLAQVPLQMLITVKHEICLLCLTLTKTKTCTIKHTHTEKHNSMLLPSMAQLGWALLFLLGSWSSVEEGLPLPRAGSLPWAPPLLGAEVAELLQGSPPSVRDVLHSGPPTNSHEGSSGFTKVTGRSRLQMILRG